MREFDFWERKLAEAERQVTVIRAQLSMDLRARPVPRRRQEGSAFRSISHANWHMLYKRWAKVERDRKNAEARLRKLLARIEYFRQRITAMLDVTLWDRIRSDVRL